MRAEYQHRTVRHLFNRLNENRATPPQLLHNVSVVNNLVMDVDWSAVGLERKFDDVYRTDYAGTEAAGAYAQ
jgi:hypothetical protein